MLGSLLRPSVPRSTTVETPLLLLRPAVGRRPMASDSLEGSSLVRPAVGRRPAASDSLEGSSRERVAGWRTDDHRFGIDLTRVVFVVSEIIAGVAEVVVVVVVFGDDLSEKKLLLMLGLCCDG